MADFWLNCQSSLVRGSEKLRGKKQKNKVMFLDKNLLKLKCYMKHLPQYLAYFLIGGVLNDR